MEKLGIRKVCTFLISAFMLLMLNACAVTGGGVYVGDRPEPKGGPPPHAPAHGYRAKHTYRYYPSAYVYFDIANGVYFYLEGNEWRTAVALPEYYRVKIVRVDYVTIDLDDDKPYEHFDEHKKKHPPGHEKQKGKK